MNRLFRSATVLGLVGGLLVSVPFTAPALAATEIAVHAAPPGTAIPGRYIVSVRDDADPGAVAGGQRVATRHVYGAVLPGFAADLTDTQLQALRRHPDVTAIEQDQRIGLDPLIDTPPGEDTGRDGADLATAQVPVANWGLDRIDQRFLPLNNTFHSPDDGAGVHAYVFDSGIDVQHPEFGGRASLDWDGHPGPNDDCHGHGSYTAGILGGATFGVAKQVRLHALRIFDCTGHGEASTAINAMNWLAGNVQQPAVANMSIGYGDSPAMEAAVNSLATTKKVLVAMSAGNDETNACLQSPAGAVKGITVAASNKADRPASFTNTGSCVDLFAPGTELLSAWSDGGTKEASGTSASAPLVAGAAAVYKGLHGDTASDTLKNFLISESTKDVLAEVPLGTPNRLLYLTQQPGGPPPADPGAVFGYLYNNNPDSTGHVPSQIYQRNSTGALNSVLRNAVGVYEVRMPGLGGTADTERGMAQVTAANNVGGWCTSTGWRREAADEVIGVRCFDKLGQPANGRFTVSYTRPPLGVPGDYGFLRTSDKTLPSGEIQPASSYNSRGGLNTIVRTGTGYYTVTFGDLAVPGGTVAISAISDRGRRCSVHDWFAATQGGIQAGGWPEVVIVRCLDVAGNVADSQFAVTFTDGRSVLGGTGARGHVWVPELGPGTTTHNPNPIWSMNSAGAVNQVVRVNTGRYRVVLPKLGGVSRGYAHAGAAGVANSDHCQPTVWNPEGVDQEVEVRCYDSAGEPSDSEFVVQWAW